MVIQPQPQLAVGLLYDMQLLVHPDGLTIVIFVPENAYSPIEVIDGGIMRDPVSLVQDRNA